MTMSKSYSQWRASAGLQRFHKTVSQNFVGSANRSALLFILVPLVETKQAEITTFAMEPADQLIGLSTNEKIMLAILRSDYQARSLRAVFATRCEASFCYSERNFDNF